MTGSANITSEQFLEKLRQGISTKGDFPVSAVTINKLHDALLTPNTSSNILSEIILSDPALSIKILDFVNSAFFQRVSEIQTINQAIMHLGVKQLIDLCSSFTILRMFGNTARKGGVFATAMERVITTAIFSNSLNNGNNTDLNNPNQPRKTNTETFLLIGIFSEIGLMLTSFYFPKLFENAFIRAQEKGISLDESINELTGLAPLEISLEILVTLKIPQIYINVIQETFNLRKKTDAIEKKYSSKDEKQIQELEIKNLLDNTENKIKNLLISLDLSNKLLNDNNNETLDDVTSYVAKKYFMDQETLKKCLVSFDNDIANFYKTLQFNPPIIKKLFKEKKQYENLEKEKKSNKNNELEEVKISIKTNKNTNNSKSENGTETENEVLFEEDEKETNVIEDNELLSQYIKDIQDEIQNNEMSSSASILTMIMEAYAWGLDFDRVILFLVNQERDTLYSRMSLGDIPHLEQNITIPVLKNTDNIIVKSYYASKICYLENTIFQDECGAITIPIGKANNCIGVIYASHLQDSKKEINQQAIDTSNLFAKMLGTIILKEKNQI